MENQEKPVPQERLENQVPLALLDEGVMLVQQERKESKERKVPKVLPGPRVLLERLARWEPKDSLGGMVQRDFEASQVLRVSTG